MSEDVDVYRYQPYLIKTIAGFMTIIIMVQVVAIKEWVGITLGEKTIIILITSYAAIFGIVWFAEGLTNVVYLVVSILQKSDRFTKFVETLRKRIRK